MSGPVHLSAPVRSAVRPLVAALLLGLTAALPGQITLTNGFNYAGVTLTDSIQTSPSTFAYFTGGTTFTGPNADFGTSSGIYWQQSGSLAGKTITMASGSYLYLSSVGSALTFTNTTTATGDVSIYDNGSASTAFTNQGTLTHTGSSGQIYARTFTNEGAIAVNAGTFYLGSTSAGYDSIISATGTVTASGSGTNVYVRGNVDNNGTMTANGGANLIWQGDNTSANLGNVTLGGGRALLNGLVVNTAATLSAPTGGMYELYGGIILGGTVASGALGFTSSGGYLDNVSVTGDLALANSSYVRFTNGTQFTGTTATLGSNAGIYWQQVGTIAGKTLNFGNGSYLYMSGVGSSVVLDSATTATGDISIYADGSTGTAVTNQGTLNHTGSSGQAYARTWTNEGSINVSGGTFHFGVDSAGYSTINAASGSLTASGASTNVYLRGNVDNNGTLVANSGANLIWQGGNTTANLGNVTLGGGRALLNGTLDNTASTLTAPTGGVFELYGGTISNGTVGAGALGYTSSGGYLDNVSVTGDLALANSSYVRFVNGSQFTGTTATFGTSAGLYWQQVGMIAGKTLNFSNGSYLYMSGVGSSVVLDSATTATGDISIYADGSTGTAVTNQGILNHTGSSGQAYARTWTNEGSINVSAGTFYFGADSAGYNTINTAAGSLTASGAGTNVYLRGNVDNNGSLQALSGANLIFQGSNVTANLGNVSMDGGRVLLNGTLDNTAANLLAPGGGVFELYGGTITNGTIASGALGYTSSGGYLDNASVTGDLSLAPSSYVRFTNGAQFTGTTATFGGNAGLYWQQSGTLAGKTLNFGSGAYLYMSGVGSSVVLDSATSAAGTVSIYSDGSSGTAVTNQGALNHTGGTGQAYARSWTNEGSITASAGTFFWGVDSAGYNTTNTATGTVTATGSGTNLYVRGNVDNDGTMTASLGANLIWQGPNTTANLGNVVASGGRALLGGALDNTAATLNAPAGGIYELYGGTISGGTVAAGALGFTSSGGYLDNVALTGNLAVANSSYVRFTNGAQFSGATATLGSGAGIYWQQTGTLAGKTLNFGSGSYLYMSGVGASVVLDSATTGTGDISIYTDGNAGTAVTNQGNLTHTGGSGTLYARSWTNEGAITVTGGHLSLGSTSAGYSFDQNAGGSLVLNGGTATLSAPAGDPVVNQGLIAISSGTLTINVTPLHNGLSGIIRGAGTISGDLTVDGGQLEPGNSIGTLTLNSSDFLVTAPSTLLIELGGTSSDRITFQNPTSPVNIGVGLLSVSLNLLSAPTEYTTFTIMNIASGGSGITGTFAGLPTTGSALSANFGGTDYSFHVTYLANSIAFTSVPEPSTYALMGLGLGMVAIAAWRRRRR